MLDTLAKLGQSQLFVGTQSTYVETDGSFVWAFLYNATVTVHRAPDLNDRTFEGNVKHFSTLQ